MSSQSDPGGRSSARAEFPATSVAGPRRRPQLFIAAFVVVLGGTVAFALSGRPGAPAGAASSGDAAHASATAAAPATAEVALGIPRRLDPEIGRRFDPGFPSLIVTESSQDGPISVLVTRRPSKVTVYGAVSLQQVTRILVTMQSLDGQPAGSTSAVVPESSGDGKDHLPPIGFNLQLAVPDGLVDRILLVQTSAYDKGGRLLATTRSQLAPEL